MAAPTQPFPPWLTPVPSVFTDTNGVEMTSTSVEFLPLTYLGPSIPLGSLFTFGGSTEPATIVTGTPTETTAVASTESTATPTPSTSVTAIPSSTSEIISTTSSSVSLSSSSSITSMLSSSSIASSSSTFIASSSSTSQPSATAAQPASFSGLTKGQLIGVIVASILGFIFLLVFVLALYLWCKGRPNRLSRTRFSMVTPIDQDYFVVPPGGRTPGEGSPRHSGEEQDPFLQESRTGRAARTGAGVAAGAVAAAGGMKAAGELGALPPRSAARVPPPPVSGTRMSGVSSGTGSSNSSGYGSLLPHSTSMFPMPPTDIPEDEKEDQPDPNDMSHRRGRILTSEELLRLEKENEESIDEPRRSHDSHEDDHDVHAYTALLPPPRLVDPESAPYRSTPSLKPYASHHSLDNEEAVTLLTARRVKVENLGPRTPQRSPLREIPPEMGSARQSGGILGSLGLGSLTGLGRLSWFRNMDSPRHSAHAPSSFSPVPLSDNDLETGRSMLGTEKGDSQNSRSFGTGFGPDGARPISGVSARSNASGGTVYHDAHSSTPGTPSTPRLIPPPRAHTPAEIPPLPTTIVHETRWPSTTTMAPPAYEPIDASPSRQPSGSNLTENPPPSFDVLDMPAPAAITNFGSAQSSLRDTASGSTVGIRSNPFPPGLELLSKAWTDFSTGGTTASPGSFAVLPAHDNEAGIAIDVLEEAPPSAGEGWRAMAATGAVSGRPTSRRTTLGIPMVVHPPDHTSEQGSLHSMRSHTGSPARSTGSAPAAARDGSLSSGSHSQSRSGSSGFSVAHSLGRTGSITSDGRRRHGPISPALSAFGPPRRIGRDSDILESPPPSAHLSPDRGSTVRTSGTGASGPDMSIM
ncbi:hypothetical protein BDQ17DRAFT_1350604 [Cyathus striatus]|nr:hypothetical protein BDQ17DRAFT_1350604 [Cyathus striatus]